MGILLHLVYPSRLRWPKNWAGAGIHTMRDTDGAHLCCSKFDWLYDSGFDHPCECPDGSLVKYIRSAYSDCCQMLLNLRRLLANAPFRTNSRAVAALLIVPYIVWLAVFLGTLVVRIGIIAGVIGVRLYQNRGIISGSSQSVTMVIRVMIFSLLGALALGVAVAYVITWKHDQAFDMILASLPVLAFLIFGSQLESKSRDSDHRKTSATTQPVFFGGHP
ncbi:hypothetical protein FPV67DRAFT_1449507 [Lyophyllum atratum]|nr:hypothetical protein FPV67DRAFT_1449507 [Lyophyllum atratum]